LLTHIFNPITPFVIDVKYIDKNKIVKQVDWFLKCFEKDACEFIFYSYLAHDLIKTFKEHKFKSVKLCDGPSMLLDFDKYVKEGLIKATTNKNIMVVAIHRDIIENASAEQTFYINGWIKSIGLNTLI